MRVLSGLILCSVLTSVSVGSLAQGVPGQGPGMMNQETRQQMRENMSQMQEMMHRMPQVESEAERQRLLEQHMDSMQKHMNMMHGGMMGQGMMGQGMHGPGMMANGQGMMGDAMMGSGQGMMGSGGGNNLPEVDDSESTTPNDQRLQMMENRLDQMQLMMEQMLQHQARSKK